MDYVNFKLRTGEDIVAVKTYETDDFIIIQNPIEITVDPRFGYFAKSWMMLSDENEMKLHKCDAHWVTKPSEKAIRHYNEFCNEIKNSPHEEESDDNGIEWDTVEEMNNDIEDMFASMIDSKSSTKH